MTPAHDPDPDALLARFRSTRDPQALGALFDVAAVDLFRVAVATAPDAASAEDAVQETFLAVLDAVDRWDPARRAMPWLLGILKFKVAHQREKARRVAASPVAVGGGGVGPVAAPEGDDPEAAAAAWREIERLDEPYRGVALLRWRYGLSPAEIAHVRDEAPGTTRSHLSRALDRLRTKLRGAPAVLATAGSATRGLAAVRETLIAVAARTPRATAGPLATVAARVAAAAAALLVVGGVFWWGSGAPRGGGTASDAPARVGARDDGTTSGSAAALAAAPSRTGSAPAPGGTAVTPATVAAPASPVRPVDPAHVTGRVLGEDGAPVPGAYVTVTTTWPRRFEVPAGAAEAATAAHVASTGADGRFEVAVDPEAPEHLVAVVAAGRGPQIEGPVRGGEALEIRLEPQVAWRGRVLDEAGAPVSGAHVRALVLVPWFRWVRETTSDADGGFSIAHTPSVPRPIPGVFESQAWLEVAEGGYVTVIRSLEGASVVRGEPLEVVLTRGTRLAGHVVDAETGAPVQGATVSLVATDAATFFMVDDPGLTFTERTLWSPFGSLITGTTTTDASGAYWLEHVPARSPSAGRRAGSSGMLEVVGEGYAPATFRLEPAAPGSGGTLDARLYPAASVRGRIVGADGAPLAAKHVVVASDADPGFRVTAETDADGRFRVEQVPAMRRGARATVSVVVRGPETVATLDVFAGQETDMGERAVAADASANFVRVSVVVVDEARKPVWGARVECGGTSITDRNGRVSLPRSGKDGFAVWAWAPGFAPATVRRGGEVPPEEETSLVLSRGHAISGHVLGPDDRPVGGVTIESRPSAGEGGRPGDALARTRTRSDGTFEVRDLAAGTWFLTATGPVERPGVPAASVTSEPVDAGAQGLVLRLPRVEAPPAVRAEVTVVDDATGERVERATVRFRRGEKEAIWARPDATGRYVAPAVPPGTWNVRVSAEGYGLLILRDVVLEDGRPAPPLEARLKPSGAAPAK